MNKSYYSKELFSTFNEVFSELVQGGHGYLVMMEEKELVCYVSCDCSGLMVVREKQKVKLWNCCFH
ncbi:hypothetical protein NC652_040386 [Populus alba x Populus x berolinensis]|nr:hypothetical protein NC652_040386 [Populus alba x Populus x berolinensis]